MRTWGSGPLLAAHCGYVYVMGAHEMSAKHCFAPRPSTVCRIVGGAYYCTFPHGWLEDTAMTYLYDRTLKETV